MKMSFIIPQCAIPPVDQDLVKHLEFNDEIFIHYVLISFDNIDPYDIYGSLDPFIYELLDDLANRDIEFLNNLEDKLISNYIRVWNYFKTFLTKHLEPSEYKRFTIDFVYVEKNVIPNCYVLTLEVSELTI